MKVLTIGGATQDIYLRCGDGADILRLTKKFCEDSYMIFEAGEKIEVDEIVYHSGGGSTNSAVSFKKLGFETSCFCKIGNNEAAEKIKVRLKEEKINISAIVQKESEDTGKSIIINSIRGERTIFAYRGINGKIKKEEIPFEQIEKSKLIYITSLSHDSSKLLPQIAQHAKKHNVLVATNPGISQLAKGALNLRNSLKNIDILILNSSEAQTLMISLMKTDEHYKQAIENELQETSEEKVYEKEAYLLHTHIEHEDLYFNLKLFFKETLSLGPSIVVVTDGKRGIYVANKKEILFHPGIKTQVVDTLGAGDAFGSCFVGIYRKTKDIARSLRCGLINSASVIKYIGAKPGLLTLEKIEEKLKDLDPKLLKKYPI
jgi:ribokinase